MIARNDLADREHSTVNNEPPSSASTIPVIPKDEGQLEENNESTAQRKEQLIGRLFHTRQTLQIRMARIPSEVHRLRHTHHHYHERNIRARQIAEPISSVVDDVVATATGLFAGVLEPLATITGGELGDPSRILIEETPTSIPSATTDSVPSADIRTDGSPVGPITDITGPPATDMEEFPAPTNTFTTPVGIPGSGPQDTTSSSSIKTSLPTSTTAVLAPSPAPETTTIPDSEPTTTITTFLTVPTNATFTTIPPPQSVTTDRTVIVTNFRPVPQSTKSDVTTTTKKSSSSSSSSSSSKSSSNSSSSSTSTRTFTTTTGTSTLTEKIVATDFPGFGGGAIGGGDNGAVPTEVPTSSGGNSSSTGLGPTQTKLLGGILGGVAGLALLLIAFLFLIKKYKRQTLLQRVDDAGYGGPLASPHDPPSEMTDRFPPFLAGTFFARQRHSPAPPPPTSPEASSEKGFYKVSGRKLPSAIGGIRPEFSQSSSSPQPGRSFSAGPLAPFPAAPATSTHPPFGITIKTPTPTSEKDIEAVFPPTRAPPPPPGTPPAFVRRQSEGAGGSPISLQRPAFPRLGGSADGLGRSLVSQDGSRGSRFTEDVT